MNILEAYSKKLAISEQVYAKEHGGKKLSDMKKVAIARVLANTSEYLNEAFENSVGTQFANMKTFKKFCLDLTTVALPNLIANDLVIVYPMKSRTGFIQYIQFLAGSNKGGTSRGRLFNDVFKLGTMDSDRQNYTSSAVVESAVVSGAQEAAHAIVVTPTWTPANTISNVVIGTKSYAIVAAGTEVADTSVSIAVDATTGAQTITFAAADTLFVEDATVKTGYTYDNVVIPQNDLPLLNAEMQSISLEAKARRIAVYYSQMAAFQAKTEMGIDLGEVLATQACAELSYEIDTEVVKLLVDNATIHADLTWNKRLPIGVSKRDHFAGFAEIIELGSQHIYDATQKHAANYMIAASNIKPILVMMDGWKSAGNTKINGPYFAGELNGIKVYISPALLAGEYVLGFNGDDMVTSAAVYAPYMAIVPTQLLGYSDGSMSQGFSTLYDLKLLNSLLLVKGSVVSEDAAGDVTYAADAYKNI